MSSNCACQCGQTRGACDTEFQYAVKLLCGEIKPGTENAPLVPGQYRTATNLHNPSKCNDAQFFFKVALDNGPRQGPISRYFGPLQLSPDGALEIDCQIIMAIAKILFPPPQVPPPFIKGWLIIEGDELDVAAIYTSAPGPCGPSTFHMERVQARCVPVCEDLTLIFNTGIAPWTTVTGIGGTQLGPAVAVNPVWGGWMTPPAGSLWISQAASDGTNATTVPTTRFYELSFDLCSGFAMTGSTFPVQVIADDAIQLYLNATLVGGTNTDNTLVTVNIPTNLLHAGHNTLTAEVTNTQAVATGFAVAGVVNVPKGKCPCSQKAAPPGRPGAVPPQHAEMDAETAAVMERFGHGGTSPPAS